MVLTNTSASDDILTSASDGILTITLNRPQKKNALSYAMYDALSQQLKHAREDSDIRVVVLTGSGDYFTAGNDMAAFQAGAKLAYNEKPSFHFMNTVATFNKPLIAAVNGDAIGIGVTLLLHCDVIYASDCCHFKMPFLSLGLVPEFASTMLLTGMSGHAKAAELLMIGDRFDSSQAEALGIVNKTLPRNELMPHVYRNASNLALKPTGALQITKRLMKKHTQQHILDAIDEEAMEFAQCLRTDETQSIVAKFLDRKKPTKQPDR